MKTLLKRQKGFTLTEILIALAIFSMVVAGALQVFNFVQITSESADKQIERLREVQLAFRQLEEDIRYMVPRERRNVFGDRAPLLKAESEAANSYIEFTRGAWRNPAKLKRSSLQHVKYEFLDDRLVRHHWLYVDSARDGQELTRDILTQVDDFEMEFLIDETWKKDWLVDGGERLALPEAIKVTTVLKDYGELHRVFPMPRYDMAAEGEPEREDPTSGGTRNNGRRRDDRGGGRR
ncbi:type II secretion system minor pseudopilin GspJ [Kangiella shandongensis]|uniref:type II secretion system minor pseudopilin GspJ n=1 Tax=Kangiella shandongensis TaxID=2763258 RepID=UPI001CC0E208|nr:type II secretion system minor pseudopilin GspJ [Kangiella shandongensis]